MSTRLLADRYELIEKIGEGGMSIVYRAKDTLLRRHVAIKILRPEYIKDEQFVENFIKESQAAAGLIHPNIVGVYDVGKEGNIHYIVMELVEGKPLSDIIKEKGSLDYETSINIVKQVASALNLAHKHQIIHRDVKPHNILVTPSGVAKLADFGIAKALKESEINEGDKKIMGSVHYFSPEQARGTYVDERSDIYSLGIVFYEMLTGDVPFDGDSPVSIALLHINQPMPRVTEKVPTVPPQVERIILKATSKFQNDRYANVDEFLAAVESVEFIRKTIGADSLNYTQAHVAVNPETETKADEKKNTKKTGIGAILVGKGAENKAGEGETKQKRGQKKGEEISAEDRAKATSALAASRLEKKREIQERRDALLKKKTIRFVIIAGIIVVIAVVLFVCIVTGVFKKDESFLMPNLVGLTYEQAKEEADAKGLNLIRNVDVYSSKYEEGLIDSQTPIEGATVSKGKTVYIYVSKGKRDNVVPKLTGLTKDEAESALINYGFVLGTVTETPSNEEKGVVVSQSVAAGDSAKSGSSIDIQVSDGKGYNKVPMPDLVGKTYAEAELVLKDNQLKVGKVTYEEVTNYEAGRVIWQSVLANYEVTFGDTIDLRIAKSPVVPEPPKEEEPPQGGETPENGDTPETPGGETGGNQEQGTGN